MRLQCLGACIVVLALSARSPAQEQPIASNVELDVLRAKVADEQAARERELAELRRALSALQARMSTQEASVATQRTTIAGLAEASRLTVRSGHFGLTLSGLVQVDAIAWRQSSVDEVDPSTGEPLNDTRFLVRRSRLRAVVDYRFLFGAFEIDANTVRGPQVRPIAFEVGARYKNPRNAEVPYIAAHMGLVRTPFGFEVQQSDRDRLFLERSRALEAFFPGQYDLGARVYGGWRSLRYVVGAMNGSPIGDTVFAGRDPNQSKDFVFRGGADLMLGPVSVRGGFSAVYGQGFHRGTSAGKDVLVWRDQNQNGQIDPGELMSIVGQSAQASSSFTRYALGGDLQLSVKLPRLGALTLLGELVYGVNMDRALVIADPVATGRDLRELGWYIGVTQELTQYAMIGLRYDRYDPDRDSTDLRNGATVPRNQTYSNLVVTAAARLPGYGRLILEYNHATNSLGRTTDGVPTTLPDDSFTVRGEVTF